ncbi:DUF262 domain-containing protein [Pararhizobium qamdonense]|uniref:DUF262 domain-containing protein n=1 Tax=Pararhizobium qamdonense TaxID=3031126 RepID=UPI0023E0D63F|nr:DUF262 domain-containing protein [Pararhizobium qamdonense]
MSDSVWFDDYSDDEAGGQIDEYDITATPNDFNVLTLFSFVEAGAVKIPGFQRNYVWDKVRASRLVESLILGIPVPQIFLYEQSRNNFLVIDGQQRLMSIYYFIKKRFPKIEARGELRVIFDDKGGIPDNILFNDQYFEDFNLKLAGTLPNEKSKFHGLNYATLDEYKVQLDLRPIRNIVVKQNSPNNDDSSMFEVFNRLNTGGVNLTPQEIRTSMYHSKFYDALYKANLEPRWRALLGTTEPDLHMKDIEILLRSFAMLIRNKEYTPSMVRFLNQFSKMSKSNTADKNNYLISLFGSFLTATDNLPADVFIGKTTKRFNFALFESVFCALLENAFEGNRLPVGHANLEEIQTLISDPTFQSASLQGTTRTANVKSRMDRARALITAL